ncbi:hypothetical protein Kpho02_26910 [Kitasatospora phosalacinea]|uniref:DUF2079 domain-containing protein n=1 Tax=Kitasatospora phosalacinea TaxID=2065 RepID=A0A9W6Q977_9ACTN|nr:DUF2079 domain-containing protein [Kitasatospora phosalacinea]GLW70392.1 hypothetical protein Kpho02_26910 [Kitasatospora phosalacinea]
MTTTSALQPPAARGAAARASGVRLSSRRARTVLLTLLCFAACLALGVQQWTSLQLGGFDLGIFDQGVRGYAHFGLPVSTLKSVHHEFPPGFSLLGDHFSPVLALMAPLYWVWDDPRMLLVGQAALFAAGVPLVRRIATRAFADADQGVRTRVRDVAALVYALGWPLLISSRSGFHEVGFAVPLFLLLFERAGARRWGGAALAALLLCATKEDVGLAVGAYGAVLLWRERGGADRRAKLLGWALLLGGPLSSAVEISYLIPAMGGVPGYYWNYEQLGADGGEALRHVLGNPWLLVESAFSSPLKPMLLGWLVLTTAALPLRSGTVLVALPLLAERVFSDNPNHWSIARHYDAFLWPVLVTAAIEALGVLWSRGRHAQARRLGATAAVLSLAASAALGLYHLAVPYEWQPKAPTAALARAAKLIPDGATVEADNQIAPRLTNRTEVVLADGTPRGQEYVILRYTQRAFPFQRDPEQAEYRALLLAHGYQELFDQDGVTLLHRTGTTPVPGTHLPGPGSTPYEEVIPPDVGHNFFLG